ncbi:MAG: divergent PAP2 family protein, partial [Clostridia bacterium]|nr:divergent PAP2 family protein [Clostridia bacterium]
MWWRKERRWCWQWLYADGGMPSAHSAMMTALAAAVGLALGFDSAEFAMSLVFAMIVCRDAMGIRRLAGRHSRLLRELMEREKSREKTDILP